MSELLFAPEITLRGLDRSVTQDELCLLQFAARRKSQAECKSGVDLGDRFTMPPLTAAALAICQIAFGVVPSTETFPRHFTQGLPAHEPSSPPMACYPANVALVAAQAATAQVRLSYTGLGVSLHLTRTP